MVDRLLRNDFYSYIPYTLSWIIKTLFHDYTCTVYPELTKSLTRLYCRYKAEANKYYLYIDWEKLHDVLFV